jgi:hypothetical protein
MKRIFVLASLLIVALAGACAPAPTPAPTAAPNCRPRRTSDDCPNHSRNSRTHRGASN